MYETLRERVERHLTLPELYDLLGVDFEDVWDLSVSDVFKEYEEQIEGVLEDYD